MRRRGSGIVLLASITMMVTLVGSALQRSPSFAARDGARRARPAAASMVVSAVSVPAGLHSAPFDVPRALTIPRGFHISVYARVPNARFMALTPDGNLLVSDPSGGAILLVRSTRGGAGSPVVSTFATGLNAPQGLAFRTIGRTTYLYVGEENEIDRFVWHAGEVSVGPRQVMIAGLPYGATADGDTHPYKDLAFGRDNKLYIALGSSCNACTGDRSAVPQRASIYQYNADGSGGRLFARGLRNAEGLAIVPGTNVLWAAVNERDNIAYPFNNATGSYGQVITSYVDNHPPDEFTAVRDGADYGWPYCNPDPDTRSGYTAMPFDPDAQYNPHGGVVDCARMQRISRGIQAHSAPLGLTFLQGSRFPRAYEPGALLALHGSWDRSQRTGYKVVYFTWIGDRNGGHPGTQRDLVSGWLDPTTGTVWDRPVDVVVDPRGALLISADQSGTIYKLSAS